MRVIVQPEDGVEPLVAAIVGAKKSIDIGIFRLDRGDIAKALKTAVDRGVPVRTLIAHTNSGGEKRLRKLEKRLLENGATVARTDDDLVRYHNKLMIIDRKVLYVLGFNYTNNDIKKSRSFGVVVKKRKLVQEGLKLFDADLQRQAYTPSVPTFLVSPLNARERLAKLLKGARKQLLVYDPKLTDPLMIRILQERHRAGIDVRIIGRLAKRGAGLTAEKFPGKRLHVRAIIQDGRRAFVGSQSLRKLELDSRREVGVIVKDPSIVSRLSEIFEQDWSHTAQGKRGRKGL